MLTQQFYANNKNNIICSEFIKAEGKEGIAIALKGEFFEIFLKKEDILDKYILFLRIDLFSLFKDVNEDLSKNGRTRK